MTISRRFIETVKKSSLFVCITALLILSCMAPFSKMLSYILVAFEILYILLCVLRGKIQNAVIANSVFLGVSIEVSLFVFGEYTEINSYANMPVIHRYGPLFMEVFLMLVVLIKQKGVIRFSSKNTWINSFSLMYYAMFALGLFMALVAFILNDNGVMHQTWMRTLFVTELLYWSIIFVDIYLLKYCFTTYKDFHKKIARTLLFYFVAIVFVLWGTILLGLYGINVNNQHLQLIPIASMYSVFLIVFPSIKEYNKKSLFFIGLLAIASTFMVMAPMGSKFFLAIVLAFIAILWINFTRKKIFKILFIMALIAIIVLNVLPLFDSGDNYITYKMEQAMNSLNIFQKDWFKNLSDSPLKRIEEFVNIFVELINKPIYLIGGKGIGGGIKHSVVWSSWNDGASFAYDQVFHGVFVEMHEAINAVFIQFGLFGLLFVILNALKSIWRMKRSPWIIIGLFWFVFLMNVYVSMYICLAAFMLGMYESDTQRNSKKSIDDIKGVFASAH